MNRSALLLLILITGFQQVIAQPPNDNCITGTAVTIPSDGDTCLTSTNIGSTNDGTFNGCDVSPAGNQVWFTYITTGANNSVTLSPAGGSPITGAVITMQALPGCPCGSGCYDVCDAATGAGTANVSWGYPIGTQVWIQVTSNEIDGDFTLCITSNNPPPSPGNDCANATVLCDLASFNVSSTSGFTPSGIDPDCFFGAGNQDVWFQFTVGQTGIIEWTATPTGSAEFDWALFDITGGCPPSMNAPTVSCNYNWASATGQAFGMGPSSCVGCPTSGANNSACAEHCASITVIAGNTYAILIDNYSANGTGFDFDWGSGNTFLIAPSSVFTVSPNSGCGSVTACFTNNSVGVISYSWDFGNGNTSTAANPGCQTYSTPGTYLVSLITTSSDGCTTVASEPVIVSSGPVPVMSSVDGACGVCDGQAIATTSGANPPFTYSWSSGGSSSTETGLCAGLYTVTVTDSAGCIMIDNVSLIVTPPVTLTETPVNESCAGACDGSATASGSGGTPTYSYLWSTGATTSGITGLCAGSYGVTVTDMAGCTDVGASLIGAGPVLLAGFTYNGNQCLTGNSFDFTNTGTMGVSYSWSFTGGTPATSTAENPVGITWSTSGTFIVTQTVTSGACNATSSLSITVYPQPSVTVTGNNVNCNSVCDGSTTSSVSGGTSPYTYAWSPSGGTGSGATNLCPNTYTLTVTDIYNCTATDNVIITEPPALTVVMSGNPVSCNGAFDGNATATPSGGTGAYAYQWDDPSFQTNATASNLGGGTYNVTVTDGNSCTVNGLFVVIEPSAMTLTPSSVDASCGNSDGSASVVVAGGSGPYTYSWNSVPVQTNSTAAGIPSGSYTVTVIDAGGCTNDTIATVNDGGSPTATIGPSTNVTCNGGNNGEATVTAVGGSGAYTYTWSTVPAQTNATATGLTAISYSVTVTDNLGCSGTANITITQPSAVVVSVTSNVDPLCNGVCSGTATASSSGGTGAYTYSWNTVPVQTTAVANGLCATSYTVTVLDANSCSNNNSVSLSEPTALNPSVSGVNPLCNGGTDGSVNLTISGGTGAYTYLWSPGGQTTQDISGVASGVHSVTITDNNNCDTNISFTLTDPPIIVPTATAVDASCGQSNGQVSVTATGGTGAYTYDWDDIGTSTTAIVNSLPAGVYNVTVTDANGCFTITTTTINNLSGGIATASVVTNVSIAGGCDGEATVTLAGGTAPFTYVWDDSGNQTTMNATGLCAGTYCVTVTDVNGCSASACIIITEPLGIVLSITGVNNLCNGYCNGQATVTVAGGVLPYTYSWSPSGGIGPIASNLCANAYTVTVIDANGATSNISIAITEPTAISIALTPTDPICNGSCDGRIQAVITGGTGTYTYLWDDGNTQTNALADLLCSGTYTILVTDGNSCTASASDVLIDPPAITITTSFIDATCGSINGQVCVTSSTGLPPLTFQWNDPGLQTNACATGLNAGSYNILVTDANSCTVNNVVGISNVGGPTAAISAFSDITCAGSTDGTATVLVTDGTPPYIYLWSDGNGQTTTTATGLGAGNYTVQITDNILCVTTVSITIAVPSLLVASITSQIDASCNTSCDGSITASATGGTGTLTYTWSNSDITPSISGLCANTYLLTVTDANGCQDTISTVITEPLMLGLTSTVVDASCAGICDGSVTSVVTGGTIPYIYQWDDPLGQTTSSAFSLCGGNVTLTVTDGKGCTISASNFVSSPVALTVSISSSSNVDCNGNCNGFAQTLVTGGTPSYTYSWDNNQTGAQAIGLCVGTYQITVSDMNGCSNSTSVVITEPTVFTTTIAKNDVTCNALCDGNSSITPVGGVPPYAYQWDDGLLQTTITATALCAGVVNVTITDFNGCIQTESINIGEPQLLTFIASSNSSTCGDPNGDACISIIGGVFPYNVTWNDPGLTSGLCIDSVVGGTYTPVLIDGNGCIFSQPVIINDVVGPAIDTITVTDVTCSGYANGLATATLDTLGTAPYTFIWKNNSGDTIGSNSSIIFGLSGGYYSLTIKDANGCVYSENFIVNEPSQFVANVVTSSAATCFGACDGNALAAAGGGTLPLTYSWAPSGATGTFADSLCAGTHNVFVTDSNGCTASGSVIIAQPALLTVNMFVTNVSCFGGNDGAIDLLPSPYGGTPPYLYSWSPNIGSGATVTNVSAGIDTVTVTDILGCTISQAILVTEPPELLLNISAISSTCGDPNGELIASVSGGTGAYTYAWDSPGTPTTSSVTGLSAGTYNITVSDQNGCPVIDSEVLTNIEGVTLTSISGTDETCFGSGDGTVSVSIFRGVPPFTFVWSTGNPSDSNATGLSSGMVTVTVIDANGCTDIDSILISSPLALVLAVSAPDTICYGATALIVANVSDGTSPYAYSWDNGLPTSSSHTVVLTLPNQVIYNVTVTDANGCIETENFAINVHPPLVVGLVPINACVGDNVSVLATGTGGNGTYTYTWNNNTFIGNPIILSNIQSDTTMTVTLSDNCSQDDVALTNITVFPSPAAGMSSACAPDPYQVQFTDLSTGNGGVIITWDWDFGDGNYSNDQNPAHDYTSTNSYMVQLVVTTADNCTDIVTIPVQSPPTADFIMQQSGKPLIEPVEISILSSQVDLIDASSNTVVDWFWNFYYPSTNMGGDSTAIIQNVSHNYDSAGYYSILLLVTDINGCIDTAIKSVRIKGEYIIFVPNSFTPNGDGINDLFYPQILGINDEEFEMYIFDRWGDRIFKYDDLYKGFEGWNGKANSGSAIAQNDVYVWMVVTEDINGETHRYVGHVTLIR